MSSSAILNQTKLFHGADILAYGYRKTFCLGREHANCINVHLDSALPEDWYQSMLHCRHTVGVNYGK